MTVVVLGTALPVRAQDLPADKAPAPAPAAQDPEHPAWHGNASVGFAFAAGVQEQKSFQFDAGITRPFSDGGSFYATADKSYQHVTFPSEGVLADRTNLAVGATQNITKYSTVMAQSEYLKDAQLSINSRYEELFGYGVHYYDKDKKKYDFVFAPGVSFYHEDLAFANQEGWKGGYGFLEKFKGSFDKTWSVSNSFRLRKNFSDTNRSVESVASLEGMFNKAVGLQFSYQYNYESIVPPGFPNYLSIVTAGLKFQF